MKLFAFVSLLIFLSIIDAFAQSIDNAGDCNINANGSNNTFIINCGNEEADPSDEISVVIGRDTNPVYLFAYNSFGVEQQWSFNNGFVIDGNSYFEITFGKERIKHFISSGRFSGDELSIVPGTYPYSMTIHLQYVDGRNSTATCRGLIKVFTDVLLYPRYRIHVDPGTDQMTSAGCFFIGVI